MNLKGNCTDVQEEVNAEELPSYTFYFLWIKDYF